jgi:hypothetical protein
MRNFELLSGVIDPFVIEACYENEPIHGILKAACRDTQKVYGAAAFGCDYGCCAAAVLSDSDGGQQG